METRKLTPAIRRQIVARIADGEKQKDLAAEFGVSRARISQIVKAHTEKNHTPSGLVAVGPPSPAAVVSPLEDFTDFSVKQLFNRYHDCWKELSEIEADKEERVHKIRDCKIRITRETKSLAETDDPLYQKSVEQSILAWRAKIAYYENQARLDFRLQELHVEIARLVAEIRARGDAVPRVTRFPTIFK